MEKNFQCHFMSCYVILHMYFICHLFISLVMTKEGIPKTLLESKMIEALFLKIAIDCVMKIANKLSSAQAT